MTTKPRPPIDRAAEFKRRVKLMHNGKLVSLAKYGPINGASALRALRALLPVVGDGSLEMRASSIPGAGFGIFAKRPFATNEIVSFYGGPVVPFVNLDNIAPELRSHARSLIHMTYMILGNVSEDGKRLLKTPADAQGAGAAPFINDPKGSGTKANVDFDFIDDVVNEKRDSIIERLDPKRRLSIAVATRDIAAGDELFVSYGRRYWNQYEDDVDADDVDAATLFKFADIPGLMLKAVPLQGVATDQCVACDAAATGACGTCFAADFYCSEACFAAHVCEDS